MLQGGRSYTADELARDLEVSRRTVFRDLNMLEMAHIPYYFDNVSNGYRINQHFFLPPVNLTLSEALAMLTLVGTIKDGAHLPLVSEGSKAAIKLESVLPPAIREHVGDILKGLSFSLGPVSRHDGLDGMFDDLAQAIAGRKVCRIVYNSFQDQKELDLQLHPLRLVFQSRGWYLVAYSPAHKETRTFKLTRIRKLTVQRAVFAPPKAPLGPEPYGQAWSMIPEGCLHDVHLRFAPKVAGNVAEVQWHPSQEVQVNSDQSIDFRVRVDGLGEISWWVLGYGDQVEVVSPPALQKRIADVAGAMVLRYQGRAN